MSSTTYLVTGCSRGLGLEIIRQLLEKEPYSKLIATVRTPSTATALLKLQASTKSNDRLVIIPLDVNKKESIYVAARTAESFLPDGLDVLINNAGVSLCKEHPDIDGFDPELFYQELWTNTVAPNIVTQAFLPLLRKGKKRKVAFMTTVLASITLADQFNISSTLSASKAALNMTIKKWANQLAGEGFVFVPVHPGWVKTEMGGPDAMIDVETSITGVLQQINAATLQSSGVFVGYDGQTLPW